MAGSWQNSRNSLRGAGWTCEPGSYKPYVPPKRPLSWLDPAMLWESRNDIVAKHVGDPVDDLRRAWMSAVRERAERDGVADPLRIDHTGSAEIAFMVIGDPGEGDASQWATIPALESSWDDTAFVAIMSDVIYPAGCVNEYEDKFYKPYRNYPGPIYAIPGNHDWYDELEGFMYHLCRIDDQPPADLTYRKKLSRRRLKLHDAFWRKPLDRHPGQDGVRANWRSLPEQQSSQRAPYWTIDTDPLLIVGIDTGITGGIDRDQGEWLRQISTADDRPKILLTGKPIYVDGKYHPGPIEGGGTVDQIVRAPESNYVAAIGGDIHNYQRYNVDLDDGRRIPYFVAGGGGAFMHPTHHIPKVRLPGCDEDSFRCYPRRGDSLARFSRLYDKKLAFGRGFLEISPDEAAAYMGELLQIEPSRASSEEVVVSDRARRAAQRVMPLPGKAPSFVQPLFALWFDINDPPMFKSFLRIEASEGEIRIRCLAATGCRSQQDNPPIEDSQVAERRKDGVWIWSAEQG